MYLLCPKTFFLLHMKRMFQRSNMAAWEQRTPLDGATGVSVARQWFPSLGFSEVEQGFTVSDREQRGSLGRQGRRRVKNRPGYRPKVDKQPAQKAVGSKTRGSGRHNRYTRTWPGNAMSAPSNAWFVIVDMLKAVLANSRTQCSSWLPSGLARISMATASESLHASHLTWTP